MSSFNVDEFREKQIKELLSQYLYWQMEMKDNILEGRPENIYPELLKVEKIHEISLIYKDMKAEINWEKIYEEASEKARKQYFDEKKEAK